MHLLGLQGEPSAKLFISWVRMATAILNLRTFNVSLFRPQNTSHQIISWLYSRTFNNTLGMKTVAVSANHRRTANRR